MKDFENRQPKQPLNKDKTVNAPLGGTKQTDKTRQQPTGAGTGGIHNQKTPTGGAGTQRPWEKDKNQDR